MTTPVEPDPAHQIQVSARTRGRYVKDYCECCGRMKTGVVRTTLGDRLCRTCMKTATNEDVAAAKALHDAWLTTRTPKETRS